MSRRWVSTPTFAVALLLVAFGRLPATEAQTGTPVPDRHPLVGSWSVVLTFAGSTGTGGPELPSLVTYTADGSVLVANAGQLPSSLPPASGLFFTEGHGTWLPTGERTADATFRFLVLNQTGGLASTSTVRTSVEVDAGSDAYAGSFTIDLISPSGNPTGTERGVFRATRIPVEPLGTPMAANPTP